MEGKEDKSREVLNSLVWELNEETMVEKMNHENVFDCKVGK